MVLLLSLLALLPIGSAQALLTIEISGVEESALPIAVVPFSWDGPGAEPAVDLADVIASDLRRSGRFQPMARANLVSTPHAFNEVNIADWRVLGSEALVVGSVTLLPQRRARVQFELIDVPRGRMLKGRVYDNIGLDQLRQVSHRIADLVYETLTGERGAFSTHIAYITAFPARGKTEHYELKIADSDGFNERSILRSSEPLLSPSWSPDGRQLAYVSFEDGRPEVWVHRIASGERRVVAKWPGLNSAPAWSPDGTRLALSLSRDGNPEIYVLRLRDSALTRITNSRAIDTEPSWMPDGRQLVFTSNRGGSPQIYRVSSLGGVPSRVTFEGSYNAGASVAPDGGSMVMVHRESGAYRIATLDLKNGAMLVLTGSSLDESPSFAPNGRMVLYATEQGGRGVLTAVTVDGRASHSLTVQKGSVREPAWAPFNDG